MKLKYECKKSLRIKHSFIGMSTFDDYWYCRETGKWCVASERDSSKYGYSTHSRCRSVRAFKRKLKSCPDGVEFVLVSRYRGHDVYGKGSYLKQV